MTDIRTPEDEVDRPGYYYLPFTEGWTYQGQTYAGHSNHAVDWNRRTPSGGWLDDTGDPVFASADGTVAEVDKSNGLVMLNHWGGLYRTESRHMSDIPVKVGQKVERGDRIGRVGNVAGDGRSFGSHLHAVHYRRDKVTSPWRRVPMRFYDKAVEVSVADSDTKPAAWTPPAPVMLEGPPPKATWESAFREASKALAKSDAAREDWREKSALFKDERDLARSDLTSAVAELAQANARIVELEAATPNDCTKAVADARKSAFLEAASTAHAAIVKLS